MREAWRINKDVLYQAVPEGVQLHVFFIFTGAEIPDYIDVNKVVSTAINKLAEELGKHV